MKFKNNWSLEELKTNKLNFFCKFNLPGREQKFALVELNQLLKLWAFMLFIMLPYYQVLASSKSRKHLIKIQATINFLQPFGKGSNLGGIKRCNFFQQIQACMWFPKTQHLGLFWTFDCFFFKFLIG